MRLFSTFRRAWVPAALLTALLPCLAHAATIRVTVQGTDADLGETPVVVPVAASIPVGPYRFQGESTDLPAHVFRDDETTYLGVIFDRVPARSRVTYTLQRDSGEPRSGGIAIDPEPGQPGSLSIRVGGKLLTRSVTEGTPKPILYPLIGPTGAEVTRDFPMKTVAGEDTDHPHQRSFWFTHGKVNDIDFWTELKNHGSIRQAEIKTRVGGPAVGILRTTNRWVGPDDRPVCEDERVYRFYETQKARVFDFEITLKATRGAVTFGDTKEGTFGLRVASSMDASRKSGGKITNAEGLTNEAAWGKPSPWVDYSGPVQGRTVGIALLNHPDSFRFPTYWHVRPYGLFAANPFGRHDFGQGADGSYTLPAGQSFTLRYRVILHEGDLAAADVARAFQSYAHPPTVEVVSE